MKLIFLDGESKGGKTAVGRHIRQTLESEALQVRLVVSGNFFRTVTLLVLERLENKQPSDDELLRLAVDVLGLPELNNQYTDEQLQSPEVDALVSRIGSFDAVQTAVVTWRWIMAKKALDDGIDILLFDGRNLRRKLHDWAEASGIPVALELIIYCRPEVAAARLLSDEGNKTPSVAELDEATVKIASRRQIDRQRKEAAYTDPADPIRLVAGTHNADQAVQDAFANDVIDPPRPIIFDNSEVPLNEGLATVAELAVKAVERSDT